MTIWPVTFLEIENEWTDDQFFMFAERASDRITRENRTAKRAAKDSGSTDTGGVGGGSKSVSMSEFLAKDRAEKGIADNG